MSSDHAQRLEEKVMEATKRLARLKARSMLREMREEHRARELARRKHHQRRIALGDVVMEAGLDEWQPNELLGLLLHALDDVGQSPTARMSLRKRGEARRGVAVEEGPPA